MGKAGTTTLGARQAAATEGLGAAHVQLNSHGVLTAAAGRLRPVVDGVCRGQRGGVHGSVT